MGNAYKCSTCKLLREQRQSHNCQLAYHMNKKGIREKRASHTHRCQREGKISLSGRFHDQKPIQPFVLGTKKLPPFFSQFFCKEEAQFSANRPLSDPMHHPTRYSMGQSSIPSKWLENSLAPQGSHAKPISMLLWSIFFFPWEIVIYRLLCQGPGGTEIGSSHLSLENGKLQCTPITNGLQACHFSFLDYIESVHKAVSACFDQGIWGWV